MKANKIDRKQETKKLKSFLENEVFPELKRMKLGKAHQEAIKEVIWSKVNQQISYFSDDKNNPGGSMKESTLYIYHIQYTSRGEDISPHSCQPPSFYTYRKAADARCSP